MLVVNRFSGCSFISAFVLPFVLLTSLAANADEDIVWSGAFETGDFMQWHNLAGTRPNFGGIPKYCRPEGDGGYYGDGSCLTLVDEPVRHGRHAAKFTVKNSVHGEEPRDCDPMGDRCERRRSELPHAAQALVHEAMPYKSARWMSVSFFVPSDWDDRGSSWGPILFQVKPINESGVSPAIGLELSNGSWQVNHRWSDVENPHSSDVPWQQSMYYRSDYPVNGESPRWDDGERHFPDVTASREALGSINKGGWTDWVFHVRYDARGSEDGGRGFLRAYKREGSGQWIKVLDIEPGWTRRGGETFDHGIGYNSPPTSNNNGGFGMRVGMYMSKGQVWNRPGNRVVYIDNPRIGGEGASLRMMAPDGGNTLMVPAAPSSLEVTRH